ncbi:MAG: hypothetical protein NT085_05400 [candidate division SR1 bacterium]|nr:hypothetical protein [candidate division SR1 bacterium]
MQNKPTKQEMKKRLAELEFLEKKEHEKLEKLHKNLELLYAIEDSETKKLKILLQKKAQQKQKQSEKNTSKDVIKKSSITNKIIKVMTAAALITLLIAGGQQMIKSNGKDTYKKEEKKEISVPEKKITQTKDTTMKINENKKQPEEKKIVITPQKTVTDKYTGEDEVFTTIETIQSDPNDNNRNMNDRYTYWKSLSKVDQNTVKAIYINITSIDEKAKINAIINGLDKKILLGLYDICVKKSFILKKQGHDTQLKKMMVITQILVGKQDELLKNTKTI